MFENVYWAALKKGVPRVIMASSVHADDFRGKHSKLLTVDKYPSPTSPYGAHKVFMEAMEKYYSTRGLEVACIRFGATGHGKDLNVLGVDGKVLWFSDGDCVSLVNLLLMLKKFRTNS